MKLNYKRILSAFICSAGLGLIAGAQVPARDSVSSQVRQIGYGQKPSWMIPGSVSSVSGAELKKSFTPNTGNTLYGLVPGLTVGQTGGEPGVGADSPTLNARGLSTFGSGKGLYILVDGYEASFETLIPDEIESITLLKDASATAIYGSKGANGVLLITTKRGQEGPLQVTFSTQQGVQTPSRLPKFLGSYDYATLYNEALSNDGKPALYAASDLDAYQTGSDPLYHPDVDWYKEVLRKSAAMSNYDLNFRGGNKTAKYFVLLNMLNSDGLYIRSGKMSDNSINSGYRRFNYRSNVDINLTSRLSAHLTLGGNVEDKSNPAAISTTSIFNKMASIAPNMFPVYNPNGTFGASQLYSNPLGDILQTGFFTSNARTFQTNLKLTQQLDMIMEGLSISAAMSFNNYFIGYSSKSRTYESYSAKLDNATGNPVYSKIGLNTSLAGNEGGSGSWRNYAFQTFMNYDRTFGVNNINGVVMFNNSNYTATGNGLPFRDLGVFGRATLTNNNKYIGEFSFGYNGSENFPEGRKYGFFPSGALAWIVSNEAFLSGSSTVNFLKLRASYGMTGNDNIGGRRFMYNQDMSAGGSYYLGTSNTASYSIGEGEIANPDVTWEKQKQLNFGIEASLFNHFDVSLDLFNQNRYNILAYPYRSLPLFTGMMFPMMNVGEVSNKGFEAVVRYRNDESQDLHYYIQASAWYAQNEIIYNSEALQIDEYLYRTGKQIGQPFLFESVGFFKDAEDIASSPVQIFDNVRAGDLKYKDQNNDGVINQNDVYPIGNTGMPKFTGSVQAGLEYKGFDLSLLFQGVTGRSVYLSGNYFEAFQNNGKISEIALGRWTPETAADATYPRLSARNNLNNFQNSSFWLRDGSFIKLRNAEIGYTVPSRITEKIKVSNARVYVNGTNLWSWDYLDFADPETITGYPAVRTFSLGLRLQM
ncbi:MAG TPA: TonB-dependent receptor [Bacteroidales bacterium]|nr:TonB-dependent receptor [Bacteroidales bacterium]